MTDEPRSIEPNQFKHLLTGKNNQKPQQHKNYDYYETDSFETELNEFISYSEVKYELNAYANEYNRHFSPWKDNTIDNKKSIVQQAIDSLDTSQNDKRSSFAQCLVYISLGNYGDHFGSPTKEHLEHIQENNRLMYEADVLNTLKQGLSHGCHQLETLSIGSNQPDLVDLYCKEIDMYLNLLYVVVECNSDRRLEEDRLVEFLFDLIVRLKEHFTKTFPLKKLMMCVYKILLITIGGLDKDYHQLKANIRLAYGLPLNQDKASTVKCTPEELFNFYQQTLQRFPTFTPLKSADNMIDQLTVTASDRLSKAMGVLNTSKNIDLPYQTLFPSKNQQPQPTQQYPNKKQMGVETTQILPFNENNPKDPYSLTEASNIWLKHMYISVGNYQIIQERKEAVHRWQKWKDNKETIHDDWREVVYNKLSEEEQRKLNCIEQVYSSIVPHFQSIVVVILKLLLSTVSVNKDKEADIVEDINITRNKETISKTVSSILLLLLKWFKASHVLKFEYLSQILVDSGCMLLILKLLGLQEVALLASKRTDDDSQSFFGFLQQTKIEESSENGENEEALYTNERNLLWTINLLRILQMLTKGKTHRILLLVQYKSSAILKRLLKVGHPTVDFYVLKNLKNQIPFMGRKWRSTNMKTISAIYSHILTNLDDDWLSLPDGSTDIEDGTLKEINFRMVSRLYNGHRYLPNILPKLDEISGQDNTVFYLVDDSTRKSQLPEYNLDAPVIVDDIDLDVEFKNDYRGWLETNVYSTVSEAEEEDDDDEEEEEEDQRKSNERDWNIDTPLPDNLPVAISSEDLTREINKLYMEELEREFHQKKIQQEVASSLDAITDGWDQPTPNTNSWGLTDTVKSIAVIDDDDADEVEPEIDPLDGINWGNLTEEELKKRLTLIEEKTTQRWMNVDVDDPRYMKVLNTFEGEVLVDDEGWPI